MAAYPIPQWLEPGAAQGYGQLFAGGQRLGAEIGMQQQRLQQQAYLTQLEMSAKEAESQRREQLQRQELEMEKAYRQAQIGLRQRELDQQQEQLNVQVTAAARKAQAQQSAQIEAQQLVGQGVPEEQAYMRSYLKYASDLNMPGASMAAVLRGSRTAQLPPGGVQTSPVLGPGGAAIPGMFAVPGASGGYTVHTVPQRGSVITPELREFQEGSREFRAKWLNPVNQAKLRDIENMEADERKPADNQFLQQYDNDKAELDKLKRAAFPKSGQAQAAPAGSQGRVFTDPQTGKRYLYTGTDPDPKKNDHDPEHWVEL